jgi:hypothetical protein
VGENQQINPIVENNPDAEAAPVDEGAAASNQEQLYVTMKKSKKFIKFKDYIIKLPNSMGLIGSRNQGQGVATMNNDLSPFVESPNHNSPDLEALGAQAHAMESFYGFQ